MTPPFSATQVVELVGGPLDGEKHPVPVDSSELIFEDLCAAHYRYCPHASARPTARGPRFIHQHIEHDFFARHAAQ